MTDQEWNIRAATGLGLKVTVIEGIDWYSLPEAFNVFKLHFLPLANDSYSFRCLANQLLFTTSYDWAMLGVKFLTDKGYVFEMGFEELEIFDPKANQVYYKIELDKFPSFKQITQAWVEVLEAENGR